ncbi:hypothetical protein [Cellulomonas sp. NPDC058312]|uniref:hypothetical protein n=1 Tax=Cellulomonas sp. NPDC058312 TaxID=3346441 RepID=UPI0036EEA7CE
MIAESGPWKSKLIKTAATLRRRSKQTRWSDQSAFLLESDVMVAAYTVRKLIESFKVSDELRRRSWRVSAFAPVGAPPDFMTRSELSEVFDLNGPRNASLSTLELCHQIVHSYIFEPAWTWDDNTERLTGLKGIFFASDRERRKVLYRVEIDTLASLIETVGWEDVISVTVARDAHGLREVSATLGVGRDDPRHWSAKERTT